MHFASPSKLLAPSDPSTSTACGTKFEVSFLVSSLQRCLSPSLLCFLSLLSCIDLTADHQRSSAREYGCACRSAGHAVKSIPRGVRQTCGSATTGCPCLESPGYCSLYLRWLHCCPWAQSLSGFRLKIYVQWIHTVFTDNNLTRTQ